MSEQQIIVMADVAASVPLLKADLSELRRNFKWLTMIEHDGHKMVFERLPAILEQWTRLCTRGERVELGDMTIHIGEEEVTKFQNILRSLGAHLECFEYIGVTPGAHCMDVSRTTMAQWFAAERMGNNTGTAVETAREFAALMHALLQKVDCHCVEDDLLVDFPGSPVDFDAFFAKFTKLVMAHTAPKFKRLLCVCYSFLEAFCNGNQANQALVGANRAQITQHLDTAGLSDGISTLMASIIENNEAVLDDVDEAFLSSVINIVSATKTGSGWLRFLAATVRSGEEINTRNARFVIQSIEVKNFTIIKAQFPWDQFASVCSKDADSIDYLISSIHLLSELCYGSQPENELTVQTMIEWGMLVDGIFAPIEFVPWEVMTQDKAAPSRTTPQPQRLVATHSAMPAGLKGLISKSFVRYGNLSLFLLLYT